MYQKFLCIRTSPTKPISNQIFERLVYFQKHEIDFDKVENCRLFRIFKIYFFIHYNLKIDMIFMEAV